MVESVRTRWVSATVPLLVLGFVAWFQAAYLLDRAIVVERDGLASILPLRAFLASSLQAGEWPMWNPAPNLGKPFLLEWQTGLFYPPTALLLVPPFSRGFNLFFVFHFASTAAGAYLLLRALEVDRASSALGALVWALGGPMVSLGNLLNHLVAISWLPWVGWAWMRTPHPTQRIAGAALALALSLLAGSPGMSLLIAGLLVLLARDRRALLVGPIAAALAALQLLPVLLHLSWTSRGTTGLPVEAILAHSFDPARLSQWVIASPATPGAFLSSIYVGPIVIALAVLALASSSPRLWVPPLATGAILLALAVGEHGPPAHVVPALPGAGLLRYPEKLILGLHALVAFAAAFGLHQMLRRVPARASLPLAMAAVALVALDLAHHNRGVLVSLPPGEILSEPQLARMMREKGEPGQPVRYYANSTGAPGAPDRVAAVRVDRDLLYAGTGELWGLANVNTPGSLNLTAHQRLQSLLGEIPAADALSTLASFGTRWVTSYDELPGPTRSTAVANGVHLYELDSVARRAFIAEQVFSVADAGAALRRLVASPPGDRRVTAIIEGNAAPFAHPASDEPIEWIASESDELILDVGLNRPGLLVINDTWDPGWRAYVDGRPASIERVNGLVRGVWLGTGDHRVAMRYRPPGLPLGIAISLTMAIALLLSITRPARTQ